MNGSLKFGAFVLARYAGATASDQIIKLRGLAGMSR
jgi:hypothetical protein